MSLSKRFVFDFLISAIFLIVFVFPIFPAIAQGVPEFLSPNASSTIPGFLKGFYDFALVVAGVLAVGAIVIGGIMYSISGAVDKKGLGKEIIAGALWGLLLLLGSYVILRTVNPKLVDLEAPALPEVGFEQCTKENFDAGKLGNIPPCKYENGDYWPIDFETGKCRCYVDKQWIEEFNIRKQETENVSGPFNYQQNGPPPSQTGCCVTIDSHIKIKNNNRTDRGVNELLVRLSNVQGLKPWRVTEACPPSSKHQSSCHYEPKCTCVDVAITPPGTGTCSDWKKLMDAARSVGFGLLNETGCEGSVSTPNATGVHVHLKLP